jgi:hypothetical protein
VSGFVVDGLKASVQGPGPHGQWESSAARCRDNGWTVGTVLQDERGRRIEITAVGLRGVFARQTHSYEGRPVPGPTEYSWSLEWPDVEWRAVAS